MKSVEDALHGCCLLDMLPSDLLRYLIEWTEDDPADPIRFTQTCKRYHDFLYTQFSPRRISIKHQYDHYDPNHPDRAVVDIISLGNKNLFVCRPNYDSIDKDDDEKVSIVSSSVLVKEAEPLLYGTKYMFFTYCSKRRQRLHLGRHVQVGPRTQHFSVGLFRPNELIQYWTVHPADDDERDINDRQQQQQQVSKDGGGDTDLLMNEEESSTFTSCVVTDLDRVKLSVDGGRVSLYNNDPDGMDTIGFLHYQHDRRYNNTTQCRWYVTNRSPSKHNDDDEEEEEKRRQLKQDASIVSLLHSGHQKNIPDYIIITRTRSSFISSPLNIHPKAVVNHQGLVCLYDPSGLEEEFNVNNKNNVDNDSNNNHSESVLNHAGVAIKVPLDVWIQDGHCCLHAPNLSFRIAVPICECDGMGNNSNDARSTGEEETTTPQIFLSSLYRTYGRRIDYVVYYCAIAADQLDGSTRSSLDSMRNQRLTHAEHEQRETMVDGNHWFFLNNKNEKLEPSIKNQPVQKWFATLGP